MTFWFSINSIKLLLRALLSLGTYVRMVPSPVVPMEIETHVLSTSENALTGRLLFILSFGNRANVLICTTWKCANHRSILLWWNLLSVWILHFCRLGKEAILAHSTMLTQCYFKINLCLLLIILHLLKVKWGGFQVTFPQKGGSEPWTVCKDGSFPRCPFGSRTICPFRIRKCADRLANFWKHVKTDQGLIVFPRPGLSREGSAPWECRTAPGSRRTGTTRGISPRKSSTGDQTGRRTRIRPISGVE